MRSLFNLAASLCGLVLLATPAMAQLPVGVPDLPTGRVDDILRDPVDEVRRTTRELQDLREDTLDNLLRRNRDVLERGPGRHVIVRSQITRLGAPEDLAALTAGGFTLVRQRPLGGLGLSLQVLRAPEGLSTVRALALAQELDPGATFDFNHLYSGSGQAVPAMAVAAQPQFAGSIRVGLIDTGVDASHPGLAGYTVRPRAFHDGDYLPQPHGSAVAVLMAQHAAGGEMLAADVYGDDPTGGAVDGLVAAMGWMAEMQVGVVNISLVGPPNRVLEAAVAALSQRGVLVVAAVGNDGPSADPLYPAAYPHVIGVTGTSANGRVLPEACRGEHVDIAAIGDHRQSGLPGGQGRVRGTSFAAPLVSAWLAPMFATPSPDAPLRADALLSASAQDAGRPGRDTVYGYGNLGPFARLASASQN